MNASNYLAELWGITFVLVSFVFLIKPKFLKRFLITAENKATMSFYGILTLVIGLVMVFVHNLWVLDWRVVITILGWLTLIKGVDLLFLPKRMRKRWLKMEDWQWLLIFTLLFLFGLTLCYLGFVAPDSQQALYQLR